MRISFSQRPDVPDRRGSVSVCISSRFVVPQSPLALTLSVRTGPDPAHEKQTVTQRAVTRRRKERGSERVTRVAADSPFLFQRKKNAYDENVGAITKQASKQNIRNARQ